jgi:hypothetical protein
MTESHRSLSLTVLPGTFAIVRLAANEPVPAWATQGAFCSVTRTSDELSVVCPAGQVPRGLSVESRWRTLKVEGPFALSEIGVLAALSAPLAGAKVSLFCISTFDTDYLLVSDKQLDAAIAALQAAGHRVDRSAAASS